MVENIECFAIKYICSQKNKLLMCMRLKSNIFQ